MDSRFGSYSLVMNSLLSNRQIETIYSLIWIQYLKDFNNITFVYHFVGKSVQYDKESKKYFLLTKVLALLGEAKRSFFL